jgi:hypothetical protein
VTASFNSDVTKSKTAHAHQLWRLLLLHCFPVQREPLSSESRVHDDALLVVCGALCTMHRLCTALSPAQPQLLRNMERVEIRQINKSLRSERAHSGIVGLLKQRTKLELSTRFADIGPPNGPIQRPNPVRYVQCECYEVRARSGQTNPLWTKITPGIAGLAAGSHARRPAHNEIRELRKTMPRPRRGSELVFGGPRAAKSSWRCPHTHTTT